ncbi:MAG TPA: glycosyltransferase [Nitrospinaceae bacterium]|nr:glycosyltransferase [Nitrospina sp.]HIN88946.1 glycosyltransferase [Nitrospinaceae bacterium]HIO22989.1 glycosyltransferase [Nitrospinaceae bacterium]
MSSVKTFSIVIPFKSWSPDLEECLTHIKKLSLQEFEVILLPDEIVNIPTSCQDIPISIISTGAINPALKRDQGAKASKGKFLAFIDDDAYPESNWLDVAYKIFSTRPDIGAIGGPAMTPTTEPFWARVSGAVFLSRISGGFPERYATIPPEREVDDWPSVNLIVRREIFDEIGGFDSAYWPGEDTLFCLKIIKNTDKLIFYFPELKVWHHRRTSLGKHLRQVGNYGLHRGYFSKVYPETSRKFKYFVPALWVLFIFLGFFLTILFPVFFTVYKLGFFFYLIALIISCKDICKHESLSVALSSIPYIIITHLWYGIKFTQGLIIKKPKNSMER